jgi:hypothetical protein
VMNAQREVVYKRRRHALFESDWNSINMFYDTCELIVDQNKVQIISKLRIRINSLFLYYFTSYWKWIQQIDGDGTYR